jgi:hypothetical protein
VVWRRVQHLNNLKIWYGMFSVNCVMFVVALNTRDHNTIGCSDGHIIIFLLWSLLYMYYSYFDFQALINWFFHVIWPYELIKQKHVGKMPLSYIFIRMEAMALLPEHMCQQLSIYLNMHSIKVVYWSEMAVTAVNLFHWVRGMQTVTIS